MLQMSDLPCKPCPELPAVASAGLGGLSRTEVYAGLSRPAELAVPGLCCVEFSPELLWFW